MFTGLIQGLGTIETLSQDRFTLSVCKSASHSILSDLEIGDSVAVDGVCLTVEEILFNGFIATASPETLQRTTLGRRSQAAEYVNLEPSLRVGNKLGGHFVSGHVDGLGCLAEAISREKAWELTFCSPSFLLEQWQSYIARYLVQKGSISVNGISLTIADCDAQRNWFKVSVIPHTYTETNLSYLNPGDLVNLECDILGKYVEQLLSYPSAKKDKNTQISLDFLTENGYL
ncbi:riboflavin synthase [Gloeothece verrucosa]|uniref:Riboflavin synthase n=1 Tax=Gloeothece verrucosa (strain PCC 7822) TaxID=497965 RepID=E0UAN8_GLOV7|nr:riboflavin synthase [Gloeothece verrucosa]ADN13890.1 riboflavin synthase, alpha subunit [Gloeothece verrucosa PCC 7822]